MSPESGARRVDASRGQSLAEYALIVALIVIVALVALTFFGTQINDICGSPRWPSRSPGRRATTCRSSPTR